MENYQKKMEAIIKHIEHEEKIPTLLLHSCCAPCSSSVLERLVDHFEVTIFYYNPNIEPEEEYRQRVEEQQRLLQLFPSPRTIHFLEGVYDPSEFHEAIKGLEHIKEGGNRCYKCYDLRLLETARIAKEKGFDYFTTTLSVSPYKNASWLNEIGERYQKETGVAYLFSDFKKKDGYRRSIALSKEYNLYRQDYCGCQYSKREREEEKDKNK